MEDHELEYALSVVSEKPFNRFQGDFVPNPGKLLREDNVLMVESLAALKEPKTILQRVRTKFIKRELKKSSLHSHPIDQEEGFGYTWFVLIDYRCQTLQKQALSKRDSVRER